MNNIAMPTDIIIDIMHKFTSVSELHQLFLLNKNISETSKNIKKKYSTIRQFCNNIAKKRFAIFFAKALQKNLPINQVHEYSSYWNDGHHMLLDCIVLLLFDFTQERWAFVNSSAQLPRRVRKCITVDKIVTSQSWYSDCVVINKKTYVDCVYRTTLGKTRKIKKRPNVAALVY